MKENILMQITNASQMVKLERDPHAAFALIIEGKTLAHALEDDMKHLFLSLAVGCASVICCRVSPKQKAMVEYLLLVFIPSLAIIFRILFYLLMSWFGLGDKVGKRRN